jgi:hypothetical protein
MKWRLPSSILFSYTTINHNFRPNTLFCINNSLNYLEVLVSVLLLAFYRLRHRRDSNPYHNPWGQWSITFFAKQKWRSSFKAIIYQLKQGCQVLPKREQIYQIPSQYAYQMAIKIPKDQETYVPKVCTPMRSKIYQNSDFWYAKI